MIKIYLSSHMPTLENIRPLKEVFEEYHKDEVIVYYPEVMEAIDNFSFLVFTDLYNLQNSDVMISHIPRPSIGAVSELAIFWKQKLDCLKIGYRCMKHPWLEVLLDYQTDSLSVVYEIVCKTFLIKPVLKAKNKLSSE